MAEVKRLYFTTIYWQMRKTEIPEQMLMGPGWFEMELS